MTSGLTLAIDVGTSAAKVALFDARGRRVLLLREKLTIRRLEDGGVEQDPESYVRSVRRLLRRAESSLPSRALVARAGIACQRSTVVVWERATGRPIGPAVTWMDRRAVDVVAQRAAAASRVARTTGLRLSPHYSAAHLARRFATEPALARKARRGELVVGPVASFVLARLAGSSWTVACDPTLAQRTSLFDPWRGRWDPWLCELFDVPRACLPDVQPSGADWGEIRLAGRAVPVRAMGGDQQCAAAAFDLDLRAGAALVHYGTGAFCLWPAERRGVRSGFAGAASRIESTGARGAGRRDRDGAGLLRSVRADRPGEFYREGTVQAAGAALDVVAGWIGRSRLQRALASRPRSGLLTPESALLVPAFSGLGAPHWDAEARAVLVASHPPSPEEIAMAALAGIAHRVADCLLAVDPDARREKGGALVLSGPLASISALVRLQAEVTGRPVRLSREPEATLLGVARIAARADGDPSIPTARCGPRLEPRIDARRRSLLRARWSAAIAASRGDAAPRSQPPPRGAGRRDVAFPTPRTTRS